MADAGDDSAHRKRERESLPKVGLSAANLAISAFRRKGMHKRADEQCVDVDPPFLVLLSPIFFLFNKKVSNVSVVSSPPHSPSIRHPGWPGGTDSAAAFDAEPQEKAGQS